MKKWLTGISIPQEYVCLGLSDITETLSVSITCRKNKDSLDVTRRHLFLGYKPLLIAIVFSETAQTISNEPEACLSFSDQKLELDTTWKGFYTDGKSVARLSINQIEQRQVGQTKVVFYRGVEGQHFFISFWHRSVNNLLEQFRRRPPGNVKLDGNQYEQVRIAYSIPRLISLITVFDGTQMNVFPTDLHGAVGTDFYLGSLRIGGEACQQVEQLRRIVISEVDATTYSATYALGKRHMKPMAEPSEFDLSGQVSESFKFPLPSKVGRYRELEIVEHFDVGIHRIFVYKVIHEQTVRDFDPLAHIHCYYAQWRNNKGLSTKYLLR